MASRIGCSGGNQSAAISDVDHLLLAVHFSSNLARVHVNGDRRWSYKYMTLQLVVVRYGTCNNDWYMDPYL